MVFEASPSRRLGVPPAPQDVAMPQTMLANDIDVESIHVGHFFNCQLYLLDEIICLPLPGIIMGLIQFKLI